MYLLAGRSGGKVQCWTRRSFHLFCSLGDVSEKVFGRKCGLPLGEKLTW